MRVNESTALSTSKVLLVPYCKHHVPQYHTWMQDADLQSATASEPLSLDEEYAMQQSWRTDRDKLTFIVCLPLPNATNTSCLKAGDPDMGDRIIGDINLFLFEDDNDDEEATTSINSHKTAPSLVGEIELMIARKDLHRQGYGRASLLAFMHYVMTGWPQIAKEYSTEADSSTVPTLSYLRVKINQNNRRSIALFESVGFKMAGDEPNYFGEVELRWQEHFAIFAAQASLEQPRVLQYELSASLA